MDLYHQHILATNRGDLTAVMADYASDATFIAPGAGPCGGSAPCVAKAAIEPLWRALIASHLEAGIITLQATGNTVTGTLNTVSDTQRAAGFGVVRVKVTVTYTNDKITRDVVEYDVGDPATAAYVDAVRLTAVFRAFTDASSRGDVTAAMALFTDDAVLIGRGRCRAVVPCTGKVEVQQQIEQETGGQARYSNLNFRVSGTAGTGTVELTSLQIRANSVERVINGIAVSFRDDKIARLTFTLELSDAQTASFANFQRVTQPNATHRIALPRGDVPGLMATFAPDAVYQGLGLCAARPCVGAAAIQREMERQVADNTAWEPVNPIR
ncbi:MAG: nuclear transport factor 2 family protein, partial [Chloroflexota bacterium]